MNSKYQIALAMLVGAALGGAAMQGLHAQAKPKAYIVTESELLDQAALAAYTPQAQAAVKAAGGTSGLITSGKIIAVVGDPPNWRKNDQVPASVPLPFRAPSGRIRKRTDAVLSRTR